MLKSVFYRVMNWIADFRTWITNFRIWITNNDARTRLKKRMKDWLLFTLLLSFLPIIASHIVAANFEFDFTLSNLANCYITVCGLAIAVHRDIIGRKDALSSVAKLTLPAICFVSSMIFGILCWIQGKNLSLDEEIADNLLRFWAFALLSPTAIIGILMQVCIEYNSFWPYRKEL